MSNPHEMPKPTEYMNWETGDMTTPKKDKRLTKAQAKKLTEIMAGWRVVEDVMVSDGGCLGLPKGHVSVVFMGGSLMGIDLDGRANT